MIAVVTPISRPAQSSSGPPGLPGLTAASVWTTFPISLPPLVGRRRFKSADHTCGQRLVETKRVADGERGLAHLQIG